MLWKGFQFALTLVRSRWPWSWDWVWWRTCRCRWVVRWWSGEEARWRDRRGRAVAEGASASGRTRTEAACASRSVQPGKINRNITFIKKHRKKLEPTFENWSCNIDWNNKLCFQTALPFKDNYFFKLPGVNKKFLISYSVKTRLTDRSTAEPKHQNSKERRISIQWLRFMQDEIWTTWGQIKLNIGKLIHFKIQVSQVFQCPI